MKRTIATICLAVTSAACSNTNVTLAQEIPPRKVFTTSTSCDEQASKDVRSDLATPGVVVAHYVDQQSPNARQTRAIDDAYSKLSEEAYLLILVASENGLSTKLSKRDQARARQLTQKYLNSRSPAPILTGLSNFDESFILYQCFVDSCPQGTSCKRVDVAKRAPKLLSAIEGERNFVRSVSRWAKSAGVAKENYSTLMSTFEKNAEYLRKEVPNAPKEVFLISTKMTR